MTTSRHIALVALLSAELLAAAALKSFAPFGGWYAASASNAALLSVSAIMAECVGAILVWFPVLRRWIATAVVAVMAGAAAVTLGRMYGLIDPGTACGCLGRLQLSAPAMLSVQSAMALTGLLVIRTSVLHVPQHSEVDEQLDEHPR